MSIVQNKDGSFSKVPDFDPVAAAQDFAQKVAAIELNRTNDHAAVDAQYDAEIAALQPILDDVNAAATLDPTVQSQVQPTLDTAIQQYPNASKLSVNQSSKAIVAP